PVYIRVGDPPCERSSIEDGQWQERHKTKYQHAATGFHALIESCGDIDEQRTHRQSSCNSENMFGRVSQTSGLRTAAVASDNEDRLDDHSQLQHIDQKELERCRVKRVAAQKADRAVNQRPERDIKEKEKRCRSPFISENTPGPMRSRRCGSRSWFHRRPRLAIVGASAGPRIVPLGPICLVSGIHSKRQRLYAPREKLGSIIWRHKFVSQQLFGGFSTRHGVDGIILNEGVERKQTPPSIPAFQRNRTLRFNALKHVLPFTCNPIFEGKYKTLLRPLSHPCGNLRYSV